MSDFQKTFVFSYIGISSVLLYLIFSYNSKKENRWLKGIQRSNFVYWLSLITFLFLTITLISSLVTSNTLQSLVLGSSVVLVVPLFILIPILIIIFGIKSIIEKRSAIKIPFGLRMVLSVNGQPAVLLGIFYILLGVVFLSLIAALFNGASCSGISSLVCDLTRVISIPFEVFGIVVNFFNKL